jgi:antitoxin (DNA-binding transcriptional repressor) of toxin-antitoxin stability system
MDDANMSLAEYARRVGEEPFVVTGHGRPVALALVDQTPVGGPGHTSHFEIASCANSPANNHGRPETSR